MRQPHSLKQISKKVRFSKDKNPILKNNQQTFDTFRTLAPKILMNANLNFHQNQLHDVNELLIKVSCLPLAIRINLQSSEQQRDFRKFTDKALNIFLTNRGAKITIKKTNHLQEFNLTSFDWLRIVFKQSIAKVQILKKDNENFHLKDHIFKSQKEMIQSLSKNNQKISQIQSLKETVTKSIYSFIFPQIHALQNQKKQVQIQKPLNERNLSHDKLSHKLKSTQLRKNSQIKKLPKLSIRNFQKPIQSQLPKIHITPQKQKLTSIYKSKLYKKPDTRDNTTTHTDSSYLMLEQSKTLKLQQTHNNMYLSKRLLRKQKEIPNSKSIVSITYSNDKKNELQSLVVENEDKNNQEGKYKILTGKTQSIMGKYRPFNRQFQSNISTNLLDLTQSQIQRRKSKFDTQKFVRSKLLSQKIVQKSVKLQKKQPNLLNKKTQQSLNDNQIEDPIESQNEIQQQIQKQKSLVQSISNSNQWSQEQKKQFNQEKPFRQNNENESSIYESEQVSSRFKSSQKKVELLEEESLCESMQM